LFLQGIALAPRFVMTQSFTTDEENSLAESIHQSHRRVLVGYEPKDDLTRENPKLKDLELEDAIPAHALEDGGKSGIREELQTPTK
jgi:hypothetical protein